MHPRNSFFSTARLALLAAVVLAASSACARESQAHAPDSSANAAVSVSSSATARDSTHRGGARRDSASRSAFGANGALVPNEMGRVPVLMYHLIGDTESSWGRERENFRRDLATLYERGYRPVNMVDVLDRKIELPAGTSPVVITFDDASPSQFRYIERDGQLIVDSSSALGIWLDFGKSHAGWGNKAVFCMLPAASAGHAFFGEREIEGQKTAWRLKKVQQLAALGFELCDHTLWHAQLNKYSDAVVQEQIARGLMAIDSAVPGYRVRSFALPLGIWPKNRALAKAGSWTDPKTGKTIRYDFDAVFEVSGYPVPSPYTPKFNPLSVQRTKVTGNTLINLLDRLDRTGDRYVSDGNGAVVARRE